MSEVEIKEWSPQQMAFLHWAEFGQGSAILEAVAGSGKTTTILEAAQRMRGKRAICAYNNKIAKDIKEKLDKRGIDWKAIRSGTVHSFGFGAIRKFVAEVTVDENKVAILADTRLEDDAYRGIVVRLVSMAKQRAIGVVCGLRDTRQWMDIIDHYDIDLGEHEPEQCIHDAINLLKASNAITDVIDFDDMVYLPLVLNCRFFQYDVVFVDEAQDTNPARRELIKRMLRRGGRLVAVGDPKQAIYGFTGADNDSLDLIAREFKAVRMPLSVTFRCPQAVVRFAHQWVSRIQSAADAPEGFVGQCTYDDMLKWPLGAPYAILCRNTKPLVSLAFRFIRDKVPCRIEGRDIAKGLLKLANRWKVKSLDQYESKLDTHEKRQQVKFKEKPRQLQTMQDQVDTMRVIMDQCRVEQKHSVKDMCTYIDNLFADNVTNMLTLSTIHKSKGREWQHVVWLDRHMTFPSPYDTQPWMVEQSENLQYVCATRSLESLYDMASPDAKLNIKSTEADKAGLARFLKTDASKIERQVQRELYYQEIDNRADEPRPFGPSSERLDWEGHWVDRDR